jgi:hypothetical protein
LREMHVYARSQGDMVKGETTAPVNSVTPPGNRVIPSYRVTF